jgi:1-acyl-sn-glycerol-3-phosphate acyltransferase
MNNKASYIFNKTVRLILGIYFKIRFRMKVNYDEIKNLMGPYIILANHTNNWDPFMLSIYVSEPIHFLTGEGNFKNSLLRWALINLVGAIPKNKFMPDSASIREIIKVKNSNGIIGIFPEGERNWHGVTENLIYSTAKLIKKLKLPVVTVVLKGAYLTHPRWAESSRRGRVELFYHLALTPDNIKDMSPDEIFNKISENLYHDENEWQKSNNIIFKGANAEKLELFIFACPHCHSFETLVSIGSEFKCSCCGYSVDFYEYGFINQKSDILHFDNLFEWDKWQLNLLHKKLDNLSFDEIMLKFNQVTVYQGKRLKNFSSKLSGSLTLYKDKLVLNCSNGNAKDFYIHNMNGVNVNLNKKIEFFYDKIMYRIVFNNKFVSAYMWVNAVNYLKEMQG